MTEYERKRLDRRRAPGLLAAAKCAHLDCASMNGYLSGARDAYELAAASLRARAAVAALPIEALVKLMGAADEMAERAHRQHEPVCWAPPPTSLREWFRYLAARWRQP